MKVTKLDTEGRIISINKVKYSALFNRHMEGVKVNLETGSVEIGSSGGNLGALSNIAKISAGAIGMKLVAP